MRKPISSKNVTIRHEGELKKHFRALLREDPVLDWEKADPAPEEKGERVALTVDGKSHAFQVIYALQPSLPWVEKFQSGSAEPPLLVTPNLNARILGTCRDHGISAIDLNGRAWLRGPGLLVDRAPLPGRAFRFEREPGNIFVGKSERIIRCLLTDRDAVWTQAEVIGRTHTSSGLVSRIFQHLVGQGFLEKRSPREFVLREPLALLDEWAAADRFSKRTQTTLYSGYFSSPIELAKRIQEWGATESVSVVFTQWIAAWVRRPFTDPPNCTAYVSRLPEQATLESLGLRPVDEGGKLRLYLPQDDGIFLETRDQDGLPLATDAQIYLDLQGTGLRGPEAAQNLREWEGFCRP